MESQQMRATTLLVDHTAGTHFQDRVFEDPDTTRERIYHLTVLEDETMVLLGRVSGELDRLETVLDADENALDHTLSRDDGGDGALVFLHARPPTAIRAFLQLPRTHEVFFDFPIEGAGDGRLRVEMIGETNAALRDALGAVPDGVDVTVERLGPYPSDDVDALLTARQREVLATARELGYYETPRRATHEDVADRIGLSVGTVTEHLQKIEARVFEHLTG
jgi:DNA-binding CsgD family transcriptional regulator